MESLDINAIKDYLVRVGCKIEYPILVNAFKNHLYNPNPSIQGKIRTQFKDYVNRLATVSLENNMKFIILRPEFRPTDQQQVPDFMAPAKLRSEEAPKQPLQSMDSVLNEQAMRMMPRSPRQIQPPVPLHDLTGKRAEVPQPRTALASPRHQQTTAIPHTSPSFMISHSQMMAQPRQHSLSQGTPPQSTIKQPTPPQLTSQLLHLHQQPQQQQKQQPSQQTYQHDPLPRQSQRPKQPPVKYHSVDGVHDNPDSPVAALAPPTTARRSHLLHKPESLQSSPTTTQMPPPRPPPRRRQSNASLFSQTAKTFDKAREIQESIKKCSVKVREHANKLNLFSGDFNALMPMRSNTRLSRDSSVSGLHTTALQRNGSLATTRSRSSHREDESDSSSLQPIDPLRRKWIIEACNCNYNGLMTLLKEDPKLANYRDIVNGYTALHWAAKFGNLDIIKLIAGAHGASVDVKSSAGHTPLHVAYLFNRTEAADLLIKAYKASQDIRDHCGKRPMQYLVKVSSK